MTQARQSLGLRGESLAIVCLEQAGMIVLARRFRTRHGELDVVALDGETLVFVEVRARTRAAVVAPAATVTWRKQRQVTAMASVFLHMHREHARLRCRFDVVAVDAGTAPPRVTWFRDAFRPGWR
jgi:putative endonuclease